jgi:CHAT domain-containing protein
MEQREILAMSTARMPTLGRTVFTAVLATAALSAIVYGPSLWRRAFLRTDMDEVRAASAGLRFRTSQARLSVDADYKEPKPRLRGSDPAASGAGYTQVWAVAARLQERATQQPALSDLHALGVSYLLAENSTTAVQTLEQAVRDETQERGDVVEAIRHSRNAALLNDLAGAYEALSERNDDPDRLPFAVEAAQRAWVLERSQPIAWTRAVVIETLHIREQSIAAWRDYLALDSRSAWGEAARLRLNEILRPTDTEVWPSVRTALLTMRTDDPKLLQTIDRFQQEVRLWCEDELLPQWGEAVLRGDASASARLSRIALLGHALEQANGGREVAGAVAAIRAAGPASLRKLAQGHSAYGAGRAADRNSEAATALRDMDAAVAALTPDLTPFASRVAIEHAAEVYLSNDYPRATAELQRVTGDADAPLSSACTGKLHALLGILALQTGSYEEAAAHYSRAVDAFRGAGERDLEATLLSRLASALESSGDYARASSYRQQSLRLLERTGDPKHRHDAMIEAAYVAIGNGQQAVADLFLDALVANDGAARNYVTTCTSLMWRSAYRFRCHMVESASADLDDAQRVCGSIADRSVRERALANLELAQSAIGGAGPASLAALDDAIRYYQKTNSHVWLRTAYVTRARITAASAPADAERDFRAALDESNASREKIDERQLRVSFTATADEIADAYVEFLIAQHRELDAFELADQSRLRELIDSPTAQWRIRTTTPLLTRIQQSLPSGAALVEYRVLTSNIVAWVVRADSFTTITLPVSINDLKPARAGLDARAPETGLQTSAAVLYDALLSNIAPLLKDSGTVVIVPDDDLERIPFSGLYDTRSGRYLLETHATVIAPSAALFVQSSLRSRERSNGEDRLVVVRATSGDAAFPSLPDGTAEAQSIARLYRDSRIIDGSGESGPQILKQTSDASLLQFVGHTTIERDRSMRALRLGSAESSRLTIADVLGAHLPRLRLTYLSACETDSGPVMKSEGSVTMARTFFAAGVPTVVGTLWPIRDETARFAARLFHEHLRRGETPAESLRQAQLALLGHYRRSGVEWAAFRVIGAGL